MRRNTLIMVCDIRFVPEISGHHDMPTDSSSAQPLIVGKQKKNLGFWVIFTVVLFLIVAVLVLVNPAKNKTPADIQTEAPSGSGQPTLKPPVPTPTGKISDISPWKDAAATIAEEPALPDKEDLNEEYKNIRRAIADRNFEEAKPYLSAERIWHLENPKKLTGGLAAGGAQFEIIDSMVATNFDHSPYSVIFNAPPQDVITPVKLERRVMDPREDIILINKKTNTTQRVHVTPWPYLVDVTYSISSSYPDKGTGTVSFVYDATKTSPSKWVYLGQDWQMQYADTPGEKGDRVSGSANVVNIGISKDGICSPAKAELAAGSSVRWTNITGMIYSVSPSVGHWDSGYLYKDAYTKTFNTAGTYSYVIQQPPRDPSQFTVCTLVVK